MFGFIFARGGTIFHLFKSSTDDCEQFQDGNDKAYYSLHVTLVIYQEILKLTKIYSYVTFNKQT